jgi:predicted nucleic-acid-binding Zn-ribbon protein
MGIFREKEPQAIQVGENAFKCPVCGNHLFWTRRAQLNTPVATFFDLDWANKSATCYVCSRCTHISWFLNPQY